MASRMSLGRFAASASRLTPRDSCSSPFLAVQCRRPYSSEPPRRRNDEVKFWPFLVVIGVGTLGYIALVNRRNGEFETFLFRSFDHVKELRMIIIFWYWPLRASIYEPP